MQLDRKTEKVEVTKTDVPPVISRNSIAVYNKTRGRVHVGVARVQERETAKEDPKSVQDYIR
jgi:hypothetical protein